MNIMNRVTWRAMWQSRTRTLVTIVGIILSAAMFTGVTTLGVSLLDYLFQAELHNTGDYFIQYDYGTDEDLENLRLEGAVSKLADLKALGYTTFEPMSNTSAFAETCIVAAGDDAFFQMVATQLEEGELPRDSSEILITRSIYEHLQESGVPCEIGDILQLEIVPDYDSSPIPLPAQEGRAFSKHYKIVGITDYFQTFDDTNLDLSHLITYADGSENPLWHRFFVKTDPADAAYDLQERSFGSVSSLNHNMLQLCGGNKYRNFDTVIRNFCFILAVIIMVGSSSLIYNAFSISVSERTKQFGLLSSIGATRAQLRRSVYFEALSLCAIGIPLGILCGYLGIAMTLHLTHDMIESFLAGASENGVFLRAVPSVAAFVSAGVISLVTVLISCRIPARRATKISPISAIREIQEYDASKANIRVGKLTARLFGLPGILAKKYYTVSKKKYRATIFSITISVVLFITAFCFTHQLQESIQQNTSTYNYDIAVHFSDQKELEQLRSQPFIAESAVVRDTILQTLIPDEAFSDGYTKAWDKSDIHHSATINPKFARIYYLEDDAFRAYLDEYKIDPAPYFDPSAPTALVCGAEIMVYSRDESDHPTRVAYHEKVFNEQAGSIDLYAAAPPEQVHDYLLTIANSYHYSEVSSYNGMPVYIYYLDESELTESAKSCPFLTEDNSLHVALQQQQQENAVTERYFLLDPVTGKMDPEPLTEVTYPGTNARLHLGQAIDTLPFGISDGSSENAVSFVLPLSMADPENTMVQLSVKVNDYNSALSFLDENDFLYSDHLESQHRDRDYITMINVFCYGFIVLISLICVCNVFNTLSTNIALRRRDFGMLRSVGIKNRELYRMMSFECLQYGIKALLFGLPISIAASVGIYRITLDVLAHSYQLPVTAMLIATCFVFLVVFITMFYAVSKLKKDNPIEAIRMESL